MGMTDGTDEINTVILNSSGDIDDLIYGGEDWHESEK